MVTFAVSKADGAVSTAGNVTIANYSFKRKANRCGTSAEYRKKAIYSRETRVDPEDIPVRQLFSLCKIIANYCEDVALTRRPGEWNPRSRRTCFEPDRYPRPASLRRTDDSLAV